MILISCGAPSDRPYMECPPLPLGKIRPVNKRTILIQIPLGVYTCIFASDVFKTEKKTLKRNLEEKENDFFTHVLTLSEKTG